jgi:hypothetical protein
MPRKTKNIDLKYEIAEGPPLTPQEVEEIVSIITNMIYRRVVEKEKEVDQQNKKEA